MSTHPTHAMEQAESKAKFRNRACPSAGNGRIERRAFLKTIGLGAAATFMPGLRVASGSIEPGDWHNLVPAEKSLDPAWVQSLFARGVRTIYRGAELKKIGMPIGGICTGQVYLGGDGRLWHWDVFNEFLVTAESHYANPPEPDFPIEQGFAIRTRSEGKTAIRTLDQRGFADISFNGEYPIGFVEYGDPECPVSVSLEAFSPFIPLNAQDSHLPATVMQFTVRNVSTTKVECDLAGWLENATCVHSAQLCDGARTNTVVRQNGITLLDCSAAPLAKTKTNRPPIVFADFESGSYETWQIEGEAFGRKPAHGAPDAIQKLSGQIGEGLANSWNGLDEPKGKLTSPPFTIERPFISFLIGGGRHPGETCINLIVDGKIIHTATGQHSDAMVWTDWNVRTLAGNTAHIEILDTRSDSWGHIEIDQIDFGDRPRIAPGPLVDQSDFGTMSLALLDAKPDDAAIASLPAGALPQVVFGNAAAEADSSSTREFPEQLIGAVARTFVLEPGQKTTVTFIVAWHFPKIQHLQLKGIDGRQYGKRFASSQAVANHVARHFDELAGQTRLWHDTWYDSTLPYWFLDRTLLNISTLATSTAYWFGNNRFYGWEGVGSCAGTCTHVWHYAQAVARLFPELERDLRERTDFGVALDLKTGVIHHRGEGAGLAVDGQAACILRVYREHQMSADSAFLQKLWPNVKLAMECLVRMDDGQGILVGTQFNTLDQAWYGRIAWLSTLYLAAARACEEMAKELGDNTYAAQMRQLVEHSSKSIDRELFDGKYYIQIADKDHINSVGSHDGCEIDQVLGQSWAYQVGLGRILNENHVKSALASLWKHNFAPDVGPFRAKNKPGRVYAMSGEGGLLMCSWPKGDAARAVRGSETFAFDDYFNECMTGFEYQVAGHMIREGMVQEGLAITRAIHDRYHAARRNPWNEVECGDHYARAMASYGVFLAACGYEYHGPKGYLAFSPQLSPGDFRAAFTTAEGWGTFSQKSDGQTQHESIAVKWGTLRLKTLAFELPDAMRPNSVAVATNGHSVASSFNSEGRRVTIVLAANAVIQAGQQLDVTIA